MKRRQRQPHAHWIHKRFELWLQTNRHRFHREPYLCEKTKRGASYKFRGVTGRIKLYLDSYQVVIAIGSYDLLIDWDVSLGFLKSRGYFCDMVIKRYRKYYQARSSLLAAHSFEPLLEWANSQLRPEKTLLIYGEPKGWSCAYIRDTKSLGKKEDYRFPIPGLKPVDSDIPIGPKKATYVFKYPVILKSKSKKRGK